VHYRKSGEGLLQQLVVPNGPLPLDEADCLGLLAVPNFKMVLRNFLNSAADYFSEQKKTFFFKEQEEMKELNGTENWFDLNLPFSSSSFILV
jgi:hypothetical protein